MKNRIFAGMGIAVAMAFLVGCGEITFNGLFAVNEPITFAQDGKSDQNGNWETFRQPSSVVIPAGQFNAKATIGQSGKKKTIKLEIANTKPATVVELAFDKNISIAENFTVTAAQLKQNFDLTGSIATKVERSAEQTGYEYCTVQQPQTVCRGLSASKDAELNTALEGVEAELSKLGGQFPGNPGFNAPNPPVCHTVWVTRPGSMHVRYYFETTLRDINASFMQAAANLGSFQGHASSTEKVITYQSPCF